MFLLTYCSVFSFSNTQFASFIFPLLRIALAGILPKASLKQLR